MARNKVKLAWVMNQNARTTSLQKRKLGLVKKVRELTILCDVKACLIVFSPNEAKPMVWPSDEAARDLLDDFFALPEIEKKGKETTLESYLEEKTKKIHEKLVTIRKKKMVDQLMMQQHCGRRIDDFNLSEIYDLISFSKEKIMLFRKRLNFMQHLPLRDPPMHPFEAQSEDLMTTTNDVFMIKGGQVDERTRNTDGAVEMISIDTVRENETHYLMDQWFFPSSEPPSPEFHQTVGMEMTTNDGITEESPRDGAIAEEGNLDANVI